MCMFHTHALIHSRYRRPRTAHLGLPLLQKRLQSLLGGSTFVVVADDQDDVVPAELTHHVEAHVHLVWVRRHGAQEGKVDTLGRRKQNGGRITEVWHFHLNILNPSTHKTSDYKDHNWNNLHNFQREWVTAPSSQTRLGTNTSCLFPAHQALFKGSIQ